ncbi:MAG: lipopolysaccharide biosynthesis protein [Bacteroidaceae bacterium]|nr:lipopolysaccharide biosynthesis protein [Bacteroidaceae bacterium]
MSNANKAISGMAWTGLDKLASYAIQFVISIVIARLLMPSDFGIIGMLAIFIAIAQTFLDSGFANALIQKKGRTEVDYATVFYFNIVISVLLYGVFYVCAPLIAAFYNIPILTDVTRVVTLSLIINGFVIVQTAKLSIDLNFRLQALASIFSVIVSGIVGLWLAYIGWGVWALVYQNVSHALVRALILWIFARWRPLFVFSFDSFKQLFSFGSKLLASSLINTIYTNIYTLVIGKAFSPAEVGFFNQGNHFSKLPMQIVQDIVVKVNYPILSELQDDNNRLVLTYKKLLRTPMFILFPILVGLCAVASPLIEVLLGEKWLPCVPILQVLCIGYMFTPLTTINLNLLYVKGRSDLVLKLEFIKKPIAFLILFASIPFGLIWMCVGKALYEFIAFSFNCYYTKKLLSYGIGKQLKELLPIFINVGLMFVLVTLTMSFFEIPLVKLVVGIVVGMLSFLLFAYFTKDESLGEAKDIFIKRVCK